MVVKYNEEFSEKTHSMMFLCYEIIFWGLFEVYPLSHTKTFLSTFKLAKAEFVICSAGPEEEQGGRFLYSTQMNGWESFTTKNAIFLFLKLEMS